ncbi:MAG: SEC-C metal-binding domain-containing protein [Acidobacteriota bacterium]
MVLTEQAQRLNQARQDFAAGKLSGEDYCRLARSFGVEDALAELLEADQLLARGLPKEAEAKYWRSADLAPCQPQAFVALNRLLFSGPQPEASPDWMAMEALCLLRTACHPALWEDPHVDPIPPHLFSRLPFPKGNKMPSPAERAEMAGMLLLRTVLDTGGLAVPRLWRHVHLATVFEDPMREEDVVWLLEHRQETLPLLAAIVDGYPLNLLGKYAEIALENSLALLGEAGGPQYLESVLTALPAIDPDENDAAIWTLRRWMAREPEAFAAELRRLRPRLDEDDLIWLVAALSKAARGPRLAPVWEELFEAGRTMPDSMQEWSAALAVTAHMVLGPEEARERIARVERQFGRYWRAETRALLQTVRELRSEDLDELWARTEAQRPTVLEICTGQAEWPSESEEEPDEEDAGNEAAEAGLRLSTFGRNDPCWCGSGKKYKKCHRAEDENLARGNQDPPPSTGAPDPFARVREEVSRFTLAALSPSQFKNRIEDFFGSVDAANEDEMPAFVDWLIHDWRPAAGRPTFLEKFLRSEGPRLDPAVRGIVQTWTTASIDLYEALRVEEGKGVQVRCYETGDEFFVHDVSSSRQLVRGDYLLSRIVREHDRHVFNGDGVMVPRFLLASFLDWLQEDRSRTGLGRTAHFRARWPAIRRFVFELPELTWRQLRLANSDGDPLEFQKAVYEVMDEPALLGALASCPAFIDDGRGSFTWLRGDPGSPDNTILGHLSLSEGRLALECNSRNRLAAGKALLQKTAPGCLRHLGDEITPIDELKRQVSRGTSPGTEDSVPPEIANPLIEQMLERHYSTWPDTPLPALGGKTPREAVRTPGGRREVEDLLLDFENEAEHDRREGRPAYDFSRLRRALGLN